jgi:hypothetical protein
VPRSNKSHVVAGLTLVEKLLEHLDARHHRLLRGTDPDDLHFFADLDHTLLDAARHHRSTSRNREDVLDRHQELFVDSAHRHRNVRIHRFHQLQDLLLARSITLDRLQCRNPHHRNLVAGESRSSDNSSRTSSSTKSKSSGSSTASHLFSATTIAGTPT